MAAVLPLLLAAAVAAAAETPARSGDRDAMKRLADERGCTTCHQEKPLAAGSNAILPPAPSWREIAAKYRGRAGVEGQLTQTVIGGTDADARHWKNRAAFAGMLPNEVEVTPDEARSLVHWILSLR